MKIGAGVVFQKPALGHASAVQVTTFGCFAGTVACLPFAGQLVSQLGSAPVGDTLNVVYLGLFPTTLGFTIWAYALARTPSGKMGATTYAVPGLVVPVRPQGFRFHPAGRRTSPRLDNCLFTIP
jgi:drug/metabolite transporter (DMT)-like permease